MPMPLRVFALSVLAASLIHFAPRLGIPLQSDVTWIYRLQAARLDANVIPYGLASFAGRPMDPLSACIAYYDNYGRWDCIDVIVMRAIATVAGDHADLWRAPFVLLGSLAVTLLTLLLRRIGVSWLPTLVLAGGVLVSPLEIWGEYTAAEAKALPALLGSLLVALSARSWRGHSLAAALWLVAVFGKEPFAAAWPAVAMSAIAGPGLPRGTGGLARRIAPHGAALAGLIVFILVLRLHPPLADYAFYLTTSGPSPIEWLRSYLAAIQPALLRGWPLGLGALAAALALAWTTHSRRDSAAFVRSLFDRQGLLLAAGLSLAIAGHGALYFLTRRVIGEGRYAVPATVEVALLCGVVVAAVASLPSRDAARVGSAFAIGASVGALARWGGDGTIVVALAAAMTVAVVIYAWRRRSGLALSAGLVVILLSGPLDLAIDDAITARIDQDSWRALQEATLLSAPRDGHVLLVFQEPNMVELAWGLETFTLLRGRTDLVYHLDLVDRTFFESETGLVRGYVDAVNRDRQPLPADGTRVVEVRADRSGRAAWRRERLSALDTLVLLVRSPESWAKRRYVTGKTPYLRWTLVTSHAIVERSTALLVP